MNQPSGATIDLSYRETGLRRAAALGLRRLGCALADARSSGHLATKPAMAFGLLAILVLGLTLYWRQIEKRKEPQLGKQQPTPASVASPSPQPAASPTQNQRRAPKGARRPATDEPPLFVQQKKTGQPKPEETIPQIDVGPDVAPRNPKRKTQGAKLAEVRKTYVAPFGAEPPAQRFRDLLTAILRSDQRLTIVANRDEADAVINGRLTTGRGDAVSITVRLVNVKGDVIWPAGGPITGRRYEGAAAVANQVVKDLLADIQKAKR